MDLFQLPVLNSILTVGGGGLGPYLILAPSEDDAVVLELLLEGPLNRTLPPKLAPGGMAPEDMA